MSQAIIHDVYVPRQRIVCTSARPVLCNVCGRGLDAGYGIRVARLANGDDVMLCDLHYPGR